MLLLNVPVALPPPSAIRQATKDIVARPDYDLEVQPDQSAPALTLEFLRWLLKPFEWLFDNMEGMPDGVRWVVVVVVFILFIALVGHIIYTLVVAIRGPKSVRDGAAYATARDLLDPAELERRAESLAGGGNYIEAVRLLFRAALRRIEAAEDRRIRPGCTNRELLRRYRATPLFESLSRFVETIDMKWYGGAPCGEADYALCRGEHAKIRNYVQAPRIALGT